MSEAQSKTYRILSIDVWCNGDGGYDWNQWWHVGVIDEPDTRSTRTLLRRLRLDGFLSWESCGRVYVEDDQYNLVVCERGNRRPLYAIEYGAGE